MTHPPAYDPLDTVRWMLEEARAELTSATYVTDDGRTRRKTKAQRDDDRVRFDTLCAVLRPPSSVPGTDTWHSLIS